MEAVTVTLNPALDLTIHVDHLQLNAVNRGQGMQLDAGGKGVNVASCLADVGHTVAVTGFLGDANPTRFEELCSQKDITEAFIRIPGSTRTGIKIVDHAEQTTTDINMPGLTPPPTATSALISVLDGWASTCPWFVFSGSLPPGLPADTYATHIVRLRAQGRSVALDTSGAALAESVRAGPTIVKPNLHELQQLIGETLATLPEIERAARTLLDYDIALVVVSMGEEGALFVDATGSWQAIPPRVVAKSSVGAGDALVAGLVASHIRALDRPSSARLATAFAAGAVTRVGPHLPDPDVLKAYAQQVDVRPLHGTRA